MACLLEAPLRMSVLSVSLLFQVHLSKLQPGNSKDVCLLVICFAMRRPEQRNLNRVVYFWVLACRLICCAAPPRSSVRLFSLLVSAAGAGRCRSGEGSAQ